MTLDYVLLTALCHEPRSGYDLAKFIKECEFWSASHQLIYRSLVAMHKSGYLKLTIHESTQKPDRKEYSITPLGKQVLTEWMSESVSSVTVRSEYSAKIFACLAHSTSECIQMFEGIMREHQSELQRLESLCETKFDSLPALGRELTLERLTVREQIHHLTAKVKWMDEVLEELAVLHYYEKGGMPNAQTAQAAQTAQSPLSRRSCA